MAKNRWVYAETVRTVARRGRRQRQLSDELRAQLKKRIAEDIRGLLDGLTEGERAELIRVMTRERLDEIAAAIVGEERDDLVRYLRGETMLTLARDRDAERAGREQMQHERDPSEPYGNPPPSALFAKRDDPENDVGAIIVEHRDGRQERRGRAPVTKARRGRHAERFRAGDELPGRDPAARPLRRGHRRRLAVEVTAADRRWPGRTTS